MKKLTLFSVLTIFLVSSAVGCTSDGLNGFCRSGSFFPVVKNRTDNLYLSHDTKSNCDPCEPVQPCTPCEPVCNPCDNLNCTGVVPGRIGTPIPTGG
ncbi:MAG: hypothetical protein LBE18_00915 [Planctomycetaceae bacterium]|jgi:hypothetical protein|nr:hypothetical protein [Planctomycetaceae bacterium]